MKQHSSLRQPVTIRHCFRFVPLVAMTAALVHATAYSSADLLIDDVTATTVSCDYLIIAPSAFLDCAIRLAAYRNESLSDDVEQAKVVELQTVYNEFPAADSEPVSHQIWYALKYAQKNWTKAPDYVVLLGDDSLDYKDRDSVRRNAGLMPTCFWYADTVRNISGILDTNAGYSDALYATTGASSSPPADPYGFNAPTFSIGRIPARTAEECSLYIDKVIRYETVDTKGAWYNSIIGSADDMFENGKFDVLGSTQMRAAERVSNDVLRRFFTTEVLLSSYAKDAEGSYSAAKQDFFDAVNKGARWSYYFGRGNRTVLSGEGFLETADSSLFENDSMPTMFFAFTSKNGDFLRKNERPMCASYLFRRRGGCIVYVAAGVATSATMNEVFAQNILNAGSYPGYISLGKALVQAQKMNNDFMSYLLLGDPALCFIKKTIPLSAQFTKSDDSAFTISSTAQLDGGAPLSYAYTISIRDSMRCIDDSTVKYLRDSVVISAQGNVAGPIETAIPPSLFGKNIKYTLYVWNNGFEARYDTVFIPQSSAVRQRAVERMGRHSFQIRNGVLTVSAPLLMSKERVVISLFNVKGSLIKSMKLPSAGVLDLKTLHISKGNYIVRLKVGGVGYCRKIYYLR
jgi:hypothetical protein